MRWSRAGAGALFASLALLAARAGAHGGDALAQGPQGSLAWELLSGTREVDWIDSAGINHIAPRFSKEVEALDGKRVILAGYRMPGGDDTRRFTLYASQVDCEFHLRSSPSRRIEVLGRTALPSRASALVVEGRLELVRARQGGVFYRLADAKMASPVQTLQDLDSHGG